MNRYYYISDSLDLLEQLQDDLQNRGVDPVRIHVLTEEDANAQAHHMNEVDSVSKKDIIGYGLKGALVGVILALVVLLVGLLTGLMMTIWAIPLLFLAAIILGFCTWEGGLIGAHKPNPELRRFGEELHRGHHLLYVDAEDEETQTLSQVALAHPSVKAAGTGKPAPESVAHFRQWVRKWIRTLP